MGQLLGEGGLLYSLRIEIRFKFLIVLIDTSHFSNNNEHISRQQYTTITIRTKT